MRSGKAIISRSPSSDTCETLPRSSPSQIMQTVVKRSYQNISKLPLPSNAHQITRLYLSHNNISSLEGLQRFTSLTAMNISYNRIKNIRQLKKIPNPHLMEKISLRMNEFEYGYEDYVVELFQNLKKLEGISLEQKEQRHLLLRIRDYISKQALSFFKMTNQVLNIMEEHQNKQNINRCNSKKPKKVFSVFMDNTFFNSLKDIYFHPTQDGLRKKSMIYLIKLCQSIIDLVKRSEIHSCGSSQYIAQDYIKATEETFYEICSTILLKFSARHDLTLRNYLQKIAACDSLPLSFHKLGIFQGQKQGMARIHSLQSQPSKYWPRIENKIVQKHSMNKLVNWNMPKTNTLIEPEKTKWYDFYQIGEATQEYSSPLYERIPLFIYCREYLEVFVEVMLNQIGKILQFQHQITAQNQKMGDYYKKDEEIQLSLSSSGVMSFGRRDQFEQFGYPEGQKPILEEDKFKKLEIEEKKIRQNSEQQNNNNNLDRYGIYEINLIFKVFRGLKSRCKSKKVNSL